MRFRTPSNDPQISEAMLISEDMLIAISAVLFPFWSWVSLFPWLSLLSPRMWSFSQAASNLLLRGSSKAFTSLPVLFNPTASVWFTDTPHLMCHHHAVLSSLNKDSLSSSNMFIISALKSLSAEPQIWISSKTACFGCFLFFFFFYIWIILFWFFACHLIFVVVENWTYQLVC